MYYLKVIFLLFKNLFAFTYSQEKFSIIGAGPVGLFLANQLLEKSAFSQVTIYEAGEFIRVQCLRIPFAIVKFFPEEVINKLWPVESIRNTIFKNQSTEDKSFWPLLGYNVNTYISLASFQRTFLNYLLKKYKSRFNLKKKTVSIEKINQINKDKASTIFITTGGGRFNHELRESVNISKLKYDFTDTSKDCFYLLFNNIDKNNEKINEDFMRNGKLLNRTEFYKYGFTYCVSNNEERNVQLYTYDINYFLPFYKSYPKSLIKSLLFPKGINYRKGILLDKNSLLFPEQIEENEWLGGFRTELDKILTNFNIKVPDNSTIHYAKRYQYAYENTYSYNQNNVPTVFVGDSNGGTDFKFGLNLGRGLFCADFLSKSIYKHANDIKITLEDYQNDWNHILDTEFGDPEKNLNENLCIYYKYFVMGRTIDHILFDENNFNLYRRLRNM